MVKGAPNGSSLSLDISDAQCAREGRMTGRADIALSLADSPRG